MGILWFVVVGVSVLAKRQSPSQEEEEESGLDYISLPASLPASTTTSTTTSTIVTIQSDIELLNKNKCIEKGHQFDQSQSTPSTSPSHLPHSSSTQPDLSRNMAFAQFLARSTYKVLDVLTWIWCLGTLILTIWCAIENHPLRPPSHASSNNDVSNPTH